uniref:Mitochondrial import receptor subunit TOM40 n=1 Tax=Polytomella parva TaxID=51329 RepID=A0A7S0V429_9CHLO|mmetsp:Transcript_273/g.317  ORF Transcript_273/g.317 Transcript_273/m.317 type:complete len:320 (+) Transcript_273:41-1000(+)|eukprot:CAMPEP_0175052402 /NCGR_PEP_ID=MMETSP0052_2-20121109/8342_1 /TAXON_ID=51329 ORGANISM="Polytomella parva, Strain SAG 63-3" /NCGR_SAMPLE_ID=MMETSP0052_2 /ASSEMBLY_ACC=CAM_ASM_000194 /LENGTH=319 /DNA_ID=CAMNT_0016316807 /DNA_START=27 /DNA_END=986 /DNA_ORIENTATION=+
MPEAPSGGASAPPPLPSFSFAASALKNREEEKANYLELPQPVRYEDIQRESIMALKPDLFEGMRFELNKPLNPNFFLSHSLFMGNAEMPTGGKQVVKAPMGTYEFGANVISEKYMFLGRVGTDGRVSGRIKYDLNDNLSLKLQTQLSQQPDQSQVMVDADVKGADWNGQVKLGNPGFLGVNYFQSVTPKLSVGGEFFWLQPNLKSGVGLAARHVDAGNVATLQVATTGILSMQYTHRVTEKISLASDLMWHFGSREATATIGYDAILRQCRLRGKVDTNGVVSTYLEERFAPGINFVLSAELDHAKSNYKFGFGIVAGE